MTSCKVQIIDLICEAVFESRQSITIGIRIGCLWLGAILSSLEIHTGVVIEGNDFQTSHKEADMIMLQPVKDAIDNGVDIIYNMSCLMILTYFLFCLDFYSQNPSFNVSTTNLSVV